jgi:hypothetical protein
MHSACQSHARQAHEHNKKIRALQTAFARHVCGSVQRELSTRASDQVPTTFHISGASVQMQGDIVDDSSIIYCLCFPAARKRP